jgi:hypothetical protein
MDVQISLRVELGLALTATVVTALRRDVRLVVPLVNLELLPLQVELAAAVHLADVLGLNVVHNRQNVLVLVKTSTNFFFFVKNGG